MGDTPETDSVEVDATPKDGRLLIGVVLRDARKQRKMTVEDICAHLRISPHQVRALESDDFSALPEPMITRGFIRNYARLLEIDVEPLLQAYRAFVPSAAPRTLTLKSENILITGKDKQPWLKYIVASAVIAVLLGAWQYYMDYRPKPSAQHVVAPAKTPDASIADTNVDASASTDAASNSHQTAEPLPVAALPAAERVAIEETQIALAPNNAVPSMAGSTSQAAIAASPGQQPPSDTKPAEKATAKLKLSFSETSWVNVTDHNKKMIFDRIMPAGSEETVEGESPFEVVVGNAPGSKLVFNDKPVDLVPYTKSNVARVTLE